MRHGGLRRLREVAGVAAGNVVAIVGEDWQHERTGAKPLVLFLATSLIASHGYVLAARQCTHPLNQRNIAAHLPGFVRPGFMCSSHSPQKQTGEAHLQTIDGLRQPVAVDQGGKRHHRIDCAVRRLALRALQEVCIRAGQARVPRSIAPPRKRRWSRSLELDVAAHAVARSSPRSSMPIGRKYDADINDAMRGNICRCSTYPRIRAAIHAASHAMEG